MLVDAGASLSARDIDGLTPLQISVLLGHSKIRKLIESKVGMSEKDEESVEMLRTHDDNMHDMRHLGVVLNV